MAAHFLVSRIHPRSRKPALIISRKGAPGLLFPNAQREGRGPILTAGGWLSQMPTISCIRVMLVRQIRSSMGAVVHVKRSSNVVEHPAYHVRNPPPPPACGNLVTRGRSGSWICMDGI